MPKRRKIRQPDRNDASQLALDLSTTKYANEDAKMIQADRAMAQSTKRTKEQERSEAPLKAVTIRLPQELLDQAEGVVAERYGQPLVSAILREAVAAGLPLLRRKAP